MIVDHEANAKLVPTYQHQNVDIECIDQDPRMLNESESKTIKTFCVKTLKINWEGNSNAYMHVFIDQTSIVKLEKAKNNIRCQKIMFASASHEFRTPLNAILNSFEFIKNCHYSMQDQLKPIIESHNNIQ